MCAREKGGSCIDALVCFLFCLSCERRACFRFWTAFNNSTVVRVHVRRERAGGRPWQKIGAPQTADSGSSSRSRRSGSSLERGLRSFSLFTYFTLFSSCLLMGGAYIDSDSAVCVCPNLLPSLPPAHIAAPPPLHLPNPPFLPSSVALSLRPPAPRLAHSTVCQRNIIHFSLSAHMLTRSPRFNLTAATKEPAATAISLTLFPTPCSPSSEGYTMDLG